MNNRKKDAKTDAQQPRATAEHTLAPSDLKQPASQNSSADIQRIFNQKLKNTRDAALEKEAKDFGEKLALGSTAAAKMTAAEMTKVLQTPMKLRLKESEYSINFMEEWMKYCSAYNDLEYDRASVVPLAATFREEYLKKREEALNNCKIFLHFQSQINPHLVKPLNKIFKEKITELENNCAEKSKEWTLGTERNRLYAAVTKQLLQGLSKDNPQMSEKKLDEEAAKLLGVVKDTLETSPELAQNWTLYRNLCGKLSAVDLSLSQQKMKKIYKGEILRQIDFMADEKIKNALLAVIREHDDHVALRNVIGMEPTSTFEAGLKQFKLIGPEGPESNFFSQETPAQRKVLLMQVANQDPLFKHHLLQHPIEAAKLLNYCGITKVDLDYFERVFNLANEQQKSLQTFEQGLKKFDVDNVFAGFNNLNKCELILKKLESSAPNDAEFKGFLQQNPREAVLYLTQIAGMQFSSKEGMSFLDRFQTNAHLQGIFETAVAGQALLADPKSQLAGTAEVKQERVEIKGPS